MRNTPNKSPSSPKTPVEPQINGSRNLIKGLLAGIAIGLVSGFLVAKSVPEKDCHSNSDSPAKTCDNVNINSSEYEDSLNITPQRVLKSSSITPLIDSLPEEVIDFLTKFDPEKAELFSDTLLFYDYSAQSLLTEIFDVDNLYAGYGGLGSFCDQRGFHFAPESDSRYHLIALPAASKRSSCFEIAKVVVHEVFGHAFDNRDGRRSITNIVSARDGREMFFKRWKDTLQSEFVAWKETCRFIDWIVNSPNSSLSLKQDVADGIKEFDDDDASGHYEYGLYEEYKEAIATGDWSHFKKLILDQYVSLDQLCYVKDYFDNEDDSDFDWLEELYLLATSDEPDFSYITDIDYDLDERVSDEEKYNELFEDPDAGENYEEQDSNDEDGITYSEEMESMMDRLKRKFGRVFGRD
jgi:hypothetical protein